MLSFTDQLGREVKLSAFPRRIISIVPSQTELLFDLGLEMTIIGITKFCIHPAEKVRSVTRVGGTKKLNMELIRKLKPDLIIANKEENSREDIELLIKEYPVWISDIVTLENAFEMIKGIGRITGTQHQADSIVKSISCAFDKLDKELRQTPLRLYSAAYFIWKNPYMAAAGGTFIDEILKRMGLKNAFQHSRYPVLTKEAVKSAGPDVVFLSSEPYPFGEKHIKEFQEMCPGSKILLVDGEVFSWYGSRLQSSPAYLLKLLRVISA